MEQQTDFTTVHPSDISSGDPHPAFRNSSMSKMSLSKTPPSTIDHDIFQHTRTRVPSSARYSQGPRNSLRHRFQAYTGQGGISIDENELFEDKYRTSNILIKFHARCTSLLDAKMIRHAIILEIRQMQSDIRKQSITLNDAILKIML